MANDFTLDANTDNNPKDWFGDLYAYSYADNRVSVALPTNLPAGLTDIDLNKEAGDARSVFLFLCEVMYQAFTNNNEPQNISNRLHMGKTSTLSADNTIRFNTYVIQIQEAVTSTGSVALLSRPANVVSSGVAPEA